MYLILKILILVRSQKLTDCSTATSGFRESDQDGAKLTITKTVLARFDLAATKTRCRPLVTTIVILDVSDSIYRRFKHLCKAPSGPRLVP